MCSTGIVQPPYEVPSFCSLRPWSAIGAGTELLFPDDKAALSFRLMCRLMTRSMLPSKSMFSLRNCLIQASHITGSGVQSLSSAFPSCCAATSGSGSRLSINPSGNSSPYAEGTSTRAAARPNMMLFINAPSMVADQSDGTQTIRALAVSLSRPDSHVIGLNVIFPGAPEMRNGKGVGKRNRTSESLRATSSIQSAPLAGTK